MMDREPPSRETEGVIKFQLDFRTAPPPARETIGELNAWRVVLYRLGLTGRDASRYGGLAYGNVSQREAQNRFIISGTQTGSKERLTAEDYCVVLGFDLIGNRIRAEGPIPPSSEALTHAAIYAANADITTVMHVHSAEIWRYHPRLAIPTTPADIAYGTPEMAQAVQQAAQAGRSAIICMQGHVDGVIAFGVTAEETALCLIRHLAKALRLVQSHQ
jgi:ribulose-5-phosphate 4-epimerase/fuculose-1-phosphate aldolase